MLQPLGKIFWQFLKNLNEHILYSLAIPFVGIYLSEMNKYVHEDFYLSIQTALFVIVKNK